MPDTKRMTGGNRLPAHVFIFNGDPRNIANFVQYPTFRNGYFNFILHRMGIDQNLQPAILAFSDAAQKTLFAGQQSSSTTVKVSHRFDRTKVWTTSRKILVKEFLASVEEQGVQAAPEKLKTLAINIVGHAKSFDCTWPGGFGDPNISFEEKRSKTDSGDFILASLKFVGAPDPFSKGPIFLGPYGETSGLPELFCVVHYSGKGMSWWANDDVIRAHRDEKDHPEIAAVNLERYNLLKVGQIAYFTGRPDTGLACREAMPSTPDDAPSIFLELRRGTSTSIPG